MPSHTDIQQADKSASTPFSVYLPADRKDVLASERELPKRSNGAVLIADISGFTPLTQSMIDNHGKRRGPEKMAALVNTLFEELILPVHQHRGSVIYISGDAVICWFDDTVDQVVTEPRHATNRALACAFTMQEAFADLRREHGLDLSVKVAIAVGAVRRFLVGDPLVQQIEVIAGTPLDQMALGESLAGPGDILLERAAVDLLSDTTKVADVQHTNTVAAAQFVRVIELTSPAQPSPWRELSKMQAAGVERVAKAWVLPEVRVRIGAGNADYLAEIRPISALFMQFTGIDYTRDPDAESKLNDAVQWIQSIFRFHEGNLLHVTLGEKGSYVNGVFGAPVAHGDDAVRAVAAAMELIGEPPEHLSFLSSVSIGITHGTLFAGAVGSATRKVYGTSGSSANLAARLMQKAPTNQIWCDSAVAEQTKHVWQFTDQSSVSVKGFGEDVAVYQPTKLRSVTERQATTDQQELFGRSDVLQQLGGHLRLAGDNQSSCIWINGDAGIGKSALLAQLIEQAGDENIVTLRSQGSAIELNSPYHALRPIFEVVASADITLPAELEPLVCLLDSFLPGNRPTSELVRQMPAEVRGDNLQKLLTGMLAAMMQGSPALIVIEDAHLADTSSLAWVARATRDINGLVAVICARPLNESDVTEELAAIRDAQTTIRVDVSPLSDAALEQIVRQRLPESCSDKLIHRVTERANGNPFFAQELAASLGQRILDSGAIDSRDLDEIALPDTVQGVVTSRIDRLSASLQLLLKVASVIGQRFDTASLAAIYPSDVSNEGLEQSIQDLVDSGQFVAENEHFSFTQSIIREVAYDNMTFAQRRGLHEHIATWYEANQSGANRYSAAELAHHWERAENSEKAASYLEQAGDLAFTSSAHPEAASFYRRLLNLELTDGDEQQGRRWLKLGRAYRGWGRFVDSRSALERALPLYGEATPTNNVSLIFHGIGQITLQMWHRLLNRGDNVITSAPEKSVELGQLQTALAELAFFSGRQVYSIYATIRSLNVFERAGPIAELGTAYGATGLFAGLVGFERLQNAYHRRAHAIVSATQSPIAHADVLRLNCIYQMGVGDWEQAAIDAALALDMHKSIGDTRGHGDCLQINIHNAALTADYQLALSLAQELAELADSAESPLHEFWAKTWQAKMHLHLDNPDIAEILLAEVRSLMHQIDDPNTQFSAYAAIAMSLVHHGQYDKAADAVIEALAWYNDQAVEPAAAYPTYEAYRELGDISLMMYGKAESLTATQTSQLDECIKTLRSLSKTHARLYPIGKPSHYLLEARWAMRGQKPNKAMSALREAMNLADRLNLGFEAARARYEIAHLSDPDSNETALLLADAEQRLTALGTSAGYLQRLQ